MPIASPQLPTALDESTDALQLSIVIPTRGRLLSLQKCLASIFAAGLPERTELLVVCNGSDPPTEDFLRGLSASDSRLHLMELKEGSPAEARNAALGKVRGEIVYFLDDDVTIAPDLFSRTLETFARRPEVDVLGGPNLTPPESPSFEQCVGYVLASPFGSSRVCDRYRSTGQLRLTDDRALILCNMAIRRSAIAGRRPVFGSELVCNEENLLLQLLALENRSMLHDPALIVYHIRRATLYGFAAQLFRYGRGRWQNTLLLPSSLSPTFLIPVFFVLYLLSLTLVRASWWLLPLAVYFAMVATFAALEAFRNRKPRQLPLMMVLFPTCHLAYAAGFLYQLGISVLEAARLRRRSEAPADPEQA
jgi:cellulose synthase/poly-beta-1,6-N-acetylglucosamine synthase-like glycosyltransferase